MNAAKEGISVMNKAPARRTIVAVSLLPVLIQVIYLSHTLLNTKPFKLMRDPSAGTFVAIAIVAAVFGIGVAAMLAVRVRWSLVPVVPALAVVAVAVISLVTFWAFTRLDRANATETHAAVRAAGVEEVAPTRGDRLREASAEYARKVGAVTVLALIFAAAAGVTLRSVMRRGDPTARMTPT